MRNDLVMMVSNSDGGSVREGFHRAGQCKALAVRQADSVICSAVQDRRSDLRRK
jgi:hypothetical protein